MRIKPNEAYFQRLKGSWTFNPVFNLTSWIQFYQSSIDLSLKFRILLLLLTQALMGRFKMETLVELDLSKKEVQHTTWVRKFGICLLQSVKTFKLDANGTELELSGFDLIWPRTTLPVPFAPARGRVLASATRAEYKMPLFGLHADCIAVMETPQAFIHVKLPYFEGLFEFDSASMERLNSRQLPDLS